MRTDSLKRQPGDPTPAQIRKRCRAIQATWDATTERHRRLGVTEDKHRRILDVPEGWQLPIVAVAELDVA